MSNYTAEEETNLLGLELPCGHEEGIVDHIGHAKIKETLIGVDLGSDGDFHPEEHSKTVEIVGDHHFACSVCQTRITDANGGDIETYEALYAWLEENTALNASDEET